MSYNGNDVREQCNIYLSIEKSALLCKINKIKAQRELSLFLIFLRQVLLKHIVDTRQESPGDPERDDQLEEIVDDLDPAEDGEASEETHRPSYQTQLSLSCHLNIHDNYDKHPKNWETVLWGKERLY